MGGVDGAGAGFPTTSSLKLMAPSMRQPTISPQRPFGSLAWVNKPLSIVYKEFMLALWCLLMSAIAGTVTIDVLDVGQVDSILIAP